MFVNSKLRFIALATLLPASSATAAITLYAEYHLGEAGSLGTNNRPLDSSGNGRNLVDEISGSSATVGSAGAYAAASTDYLNTAGAGNEGWYSSGLFTTLPTDNFAFGVFARAASNTSGTQGDVFALGGNDGAFKLSLAANGWAASSHNVNWIAAGAPVADEVTVTASISAGPAAKIFVRVVAEQAP
jgi:hypothetical protein